MNRAKISEIFFSIQGEGPFIGAAQVFVRFFGCNLTCDYCDTRLKRFSVLTAREVRRKVNALLKKHNARQICFTGGEPLLQAGFIRTLLAAGNWAKDIIYLETNGTLAEEFEKIEAYTGIVAMDIKLPSAGGTAECWQEHLRFLRAAAVHKVFVKIVITPGAALPDMRKAIDLVNRVNSDIIVTLQPDYRRQGAALMKKAMFFQKEALKKLRDVRIIPQAHKLMGIR